MAGHVATVHSFSKDYCMSGWRLGYVAAPAPLVQKMREINESNVYVAPMVSQRAGLHALALRREIFAHVNETYRARAEYVARRVADIPFLAQPKQQGGLYAFLDIRKTATQAPPLPKSCWRAMARPSYPARRLAPLARGLCAWRCARIFPSWRRCSTAFRMTKNGFAPPRAAPDSEKQKNRPFFWQNAEGRGAFLCKTPVPPGPGM